eukprot:TRINITY_DN17099_c0_g3_i1.p1 TRINITY_DN17099_c0_g3~~TRINITY_DN17099_c0_g3_i1.p1  ORF type:complete len:400 (+),score=33.28 TRINITY_DN17099_c0_g3_i1:75-1274(+)
MGNRFCWRRHHEDDHIPVTCEQSHRRTPIPEVTVVDVTGAEQVVLHDLDWDTTVLQLKNAIRNHLEEAQRTLEIRLIHAEAHLAEDATCLRSILTEPAVVVAILVVPGAELIEMLCGQDVPSSIEAANTIGRKGYASALHTQAMVETAAASESAPLRRAILKALSTVGARTVPYLLQTLVEAEEEGVRLQTADALLKVFTQKSKAISDSDLAMLVSLSSHPKWEVRRCIARLLGLLSAHDELPASCFTALSSLAEDSDRKVHRHARNSLCKLRFHEEKRAEAFATSWSMRKRIVPKTKLKCVNEVDLLNTSHCSVLLQFNSIPACRATQYRLKPGQTFAGKFVCAAKNTSTDLTVGAQACVHHTQVDVISRRGILLERWCRSSPEHAFVRVELTHGARP